MKQFSSSLALLATIMMIFVGIVSQIMINHHNKSVAGLSVYFYILSFVTWFSWSLYGAIRKDILMCAIQAVGAIMTSVVLIQFILYKS